MSYQILIYSPQHSNRLRYVLDWIFNEQLKLSYRLTDDIDLYFQENAAKINYTTHPILQHEIHICPETLLFEQSVNSKIDIRYHRWKHSDIIFYNQPGKEIPFDFFAAVFFLISRYEEYFPAPKDKHERYQAKYSVAHKFSFLQSPVVDIWIKKISEILSKKFNLSISPKQFLFLPTYDVDMVWAYKNKTFKENAGGIIKDITRFKFSKIKQRLQTLNNSVADPYFSFPYLDNLHQEHNLKPLFFILSLKQKTNFDKNTPIENVAMQDFVKQLAAKYTLGIHPSYYTHNAIEYLQSEIQLLHKISQQEITKSRQHFIKFYLPDTYRGLLQSGIKEDYSMGYATDNGFRAGTSNSFFWFDVLQDRVTDLRVFPFIFMEATSLFYQQQSRAETLQEWERLVYAVKQNGGMFISIFHNYTLGTSVEYADWADTYREMLQITRK